MRITTILYFAKVAYYLCGKNVLDHWLEITRKGTINSTKRKVENEVGAV